MSREPLQWSQFRRLLLGTVVEALLAAQVALDFQSITIDFDDRSRFQVPRFNNYMRFAGALEADLLSPLPAGAVVGLQRQMEKAWLELLAAIELPVGDRLDNEKAHVVVEVLPTDRGHHLKVAFDLEAD